MAHQLSFENRQAFGPRILFIGDSNMRNSAEVLTNNQLLWNYKTLEKLIDGENLTTDESHMWLIPFTKGNTHTLTIRVPSDAPEISEMRVWNYNKSWEDTFRGAKNVHVSIDGVQKSPTDGFTLRKAPGYTNYDFFQSIYLDRVMPCKKMEAVSCPCGFVYTLLIQSNQGDPYYVGLDGIDLLDENCQKIDTSSFRVDAYPRSVNVLENVKNDVRTPDKMVDGLNSDRDGTRSWLAPIFPSVANKVYILFNSPQSISKMRVWNYSKTASRGLKEVAILVDDLIQHQTVLKPTFSVTRGIIPGLDSDPQFQTSDLRGDQMADRTLDDTDSSGGGLASSGTGGGGGPDSVKVHQTATGKNKEANQLFRPKTCIAMKK